jgi:hypothetical protein
MNGVVYCILRGSSEESLSPQAVRSARILGPSGRRRMFLAMCFVMLLDWCSLPYSGFPFFFSQLSASGLSAG